MLAQVSSLIKDCDKTIAGSANRKGAFLSILVDIGNQKKSIMMDLMNLQQSVEDENMFLI